MSWYKCALRKHLMRFDPRVQVEVSASDANLDATLLSFISSAIIKGLDVIGLVAYDISIPNRGVEIAKQQNVDLFILPGQIYKTTDGFDLIIYKTPQNFLEGKTLQQALSEAKQQNLRTLVYNLGKKRSQQLLKLGEDTGLKADFVEIFSGTSYGYFYLSTNSYEVVSSGAKSPAELEGNNIYSHVPRKDLEERGIIPENFGLDFRPNYLSVGEQPENANAIL